MILLDLLICFFSERTARVPLCLNFSLLRRERERECERP